MDEAEKMMRLIAPEAPYGVQAEAELARIMATPRVLATPRTSVATRLRSLLPAVAVMIIIAGMLIGVAALNPPNAHAVTPPMLEPVPATGTAPEALIALSELSRQHPDPGMTIEATSWVLNTEIAEDGSVHAVNVIPTVRLTQHRADGSAVVTLTAGEPFEGQDEEGLPAPGTLIDKEVLAPSENPMKVFPPMPTDPGQMAIWLTDAWGLDPGNAGEIVGTLVGYFSMSPITGAQEAALLQHFADNPNLRILGRVVDRLGRQGIAFATDQAAPGEYEDRLIVSTETGRIIAVETIFIGTDRPELEAPAVVAYTAWTSR